MWIITRRSEHQALAKDGTWKCPYHTDDLRTFDSHDAAKACVKEESLPEDFVSITHLRGLLAEHQRRAEKQAKQERKGLRNCQYLALDSPEKFYLTPESSEETWFPVFDTFEATHSVISDGVVIGVFGRTSDDDIPFWCYTFDEYYFAIEGCYTRRQPDQRRHDFKVEGF